MGSNARGRRSGVSLLETLIALVILLIALYPLVMTFRGSFRGIQLAKEHTQAELLAEAVLEEARARVDAGLPRYWRLADSLQDVRAKAAAGSWKTMFRALEHAPAKVAGGDPTAVSNYFRRMVVRADGSPGPLDEAADPVAARDQARFTVQVQVRFGEDGPLDTDGDAKTETDMCEVEVTVSWIDTARQVPQQLRASTVYTLSDLNPARGI